MKDKKITEIINILLAIVMIFSVRMPVYAGEHGDRANSFRYKNGQIIDEAVPFAILSPNAWKKIDGRYYNSDGNVIAGAVARGIDVSYHQGTIDWQKVKADNVEFVMIRCGYGMDQTNQDDAQCLANIKGCENNGIPYGVYIYSYADTVEKANSEADHVLRLIQGHSLSYPVYYDIEDNSIFSNTNITQREQIAQTFINKISAAGYQTGIYSNKYNFDTYLNSNQFNQWNKWVAQYNSSCTYTGNYQLWQATNTGRVDGINGNVDINFAMNMTQTPSDNNSGNSNKPSTNVTNTVTPKTAAPSKVVLRTPVIMVKSIGKKKVQVSWKLRGSGVKYQIYYSTRKNAGYKKLVTINSAKGKVVIKNKLKSKKKYYFKARCAKIVNRRTYYSGYSKVKSTKVK